MSLSDLPLTVGNFGDHLGDLISRLKTLTHPFASLIETPATAETSRSFYASATPIQGHSYMISQGCYGLSQDKPIGTEHVGNCVAIILRNPQTNLTSLIHFDDPTDPKSLDKAFEVFEGQPIEAAIIGAKYAETDDPNFKGYYQDTSRTNLLTVLNFLAAKNATLTSAWIADSKQPHHFVIDPKSGQIQVGTPSIPDPEQKILFATRYLSDGPHDIALAYDLTKSTDRVPMPLNAQTIQFFEEFGEARATQTDQGLKEWVQATPLLTPKQKANPENLSFFISMLDHYQQSSAHDPVMVADKEQAIATPPSPL